MEMIATTSSSSHIHDIEAQSGDTHLHASTTVPTATTATINYETATAVGVTVRDTTTMHHPYTVITATAVNDDQQPITDNSTYLPTASASAGHWARRRVPGDTL